MPGKQETFEGLEPSSSATRALEVKDTALGHPKELEEEAPPLDSGPHLICTSYVSGSNFTIMAVQLIGMQFKKHFMGYC